MLTGLKGILFDLDGVLIRSMPAHLRAFNQILEGTGIAVRHDQIAGRSTREIFQDILQSYPQLNFNVSEFSNKKSELANQIMQSLGSTILPDNIEEILSSLAQTYSLMICTSGTSKGLENFYNLSNCRKYFRGHLNSDNVKHLKPNPEIYLKACDFLALNPDECAVVEDSVAGCSAAYLAGCQLIILKNEFAPSLLDFPGSIMIEEIGELGHVFKSRF